MHTEPTCVPPSPSDGARYENRKADKVHAGEAECADDERTGDMAKKPSEPTPKKYKRNTSYVFGESQEYTIPDVRLIRAGAAMVFNARTGEVYFGRTRGLFGLVHWEADFYEMYALVERLREGGYGTKKRSDGVRAVRRSFIRKLKKAGAIRRMPLKKAFRIRNRTIAKQLKYSPTALPKEAVVYPCGSTTFAHRLYGNKAELERSLSIMGPDTLARRLRFRGSRGKRATVFAWPLRIDYCPIAKPRARARASQRFRNIISGTKPIEYPFKHKLLVSNMSKCDRKHPTGSVLTSTVVRPDMFDAVRKVASQLPPRNSECSLSIDEALSLMEEFISREGVDALSGREAKDVIRRETAPEGFAEAADRAQEEAEQRDREAAREAVEKNRAATSRAQREPARSQKKDEHSPAREDGVERPEGHDQKSPRAEGYSSVSGGRNFTDADREAARAAKSQRREAARRAVEEGTPQGGTNVVGEKEAADAPEKESARPGHGVDWKVRMGLSDGDGL